MVSRNFIRFDHGQLWTTMVDNGQPFWQRSTMVDHGQDNDFIMVFDGLPRTNMVDHQKPW